MSRSIDRNVFSSLETKKKEEKEERSSSSSLFVVSSRALETQNTRASKYARVWTRENVDESAEETHGREGFVGYDRQQQ